MGRISSLAVVGLLTATAAAAPRPAIPKYSKRQNNTNTTEITFSDITSSPLIKWTECYQDQHGPNLECTYLTVPLDYENPNAGTADIAFMRYFVSEDVEDLLFNPGGPGESGVGFVQTQASDYAKKWNMNIVSFDPRGVKLSGPAVSCSPSNSTTKLKRRQDSTIVGDLKAAWDDQLESNSACSAANEGSNAKYVGTSAVVQDMMHFVELQATLRGQNPKTALINYYGVSYGTCVGQTLVNLYPDRLRRVLLDANVYSVAHYQGWEPSGIDDFAHGVWMFSKLCYEAGPEWCVLAEGVDDIQGVQARIDAVIAKLNASPLVVGETTIDGNYYLGQLQGFLYFPRQKGKGYLEIANGTLAIENDDIEALKGENVKMLKRDDANAGSNDVLGIITSVDIAGRYPWKTYEEWKAAAERLEATAPYYAFGYSTSNGLIGLAADAFVPPPSQLVSGFEFVNTSTPVLFVNTPGDPVTPMSSVHQMSQLFGGSSWFIHNSPGHGYSNAPSKCTDDIIAAYFADATLPEEGTWCEPDVEANYYFLGPDPMAPEQK